MITFILVVGAITTVLSVLLVKLGFAQWLIIGLAALLTTFGITPATVAIGEALARQDASTYNEYYNGYELAATSETTTCTRDGACVHEYDCDPYTVTVPKTETYTDSDGETHTRTKYVQETRYHDCPYSTQETSYYVNTTLGQYTIASSLLTGRKWRSTDFTHDFTRESAPAFWTAAKKRVDANKPGPVTQVNTYKNYILASQTNLFKRYSGSIERLTKQGLLPAPSAGVVDFYNAPKAYFVGTMPRGLNQAALTKDVAYLNGAVGTALRGDVHIVFVNAAQAPEPTTYLNSLMAYWQSPTFGRNDISKNSIVITVGVGTASQLPAAAPQPAITANPVATPTPGTTSTPITTKPLDPSTPVALWVRSATGMPVGNEAMFVDLRNTLQGQPINTTFIGRPSMDVHTHALVRSDGLTEGVLFGAHKFQRVSMSADGKTDKGLGYKYLATAVPVPTGAYIFMGVIIGLLGAGLMLLALYLSAMMAGSYNFGYTSNRYRSRFHD
jgi:hypothetical protein